MTSQTKTLRDEFAMMAPEVPFDFQFPNEPRCPTEIGYDENGLPEFKPGELEAYNSAMHWWRLRRQCSWRYRWAAVMLSERAKADAAPAEANGLLKLTPDYFDHAFPNEGEGGD